MESDIVAKAREFARHAHRNQKRNYTGQPYFTHLEEVAALVEQAGLPPQAVAAAWLHDVVEDTDVVLMQVYAEFGAEIGSMVGDLTKTPPTPGLNIASRNALDISRLGAAHPHTQSVKCSDLISNTATIVHYNPQFAVRYLPEKRKTLEVLTNADPSLLAAAHSSLAAAEKHLPFAIEVRRVEQGLEKFFGDMVYRWQPIPEARAKWWQFKRRRNDARVDAALASIGRGPFTPEMSATYWKQARLGQDVYEDAGGYLWRCWCAALSLPFMDPRKPYDNSSEALMKSVA